MAVGALATREAATRQGRPRGRLVAPDGCPGPPKCEVQYLLSEQPTFLRTSSAGDDAIRLRLG